MSPIDMPSLPLTSGSAAAVSQSAAALHTQQLFAEPATHVSDQGQATGVQGSVSGYVAMFGHLPNISDIRSSTPGVSALSSVPALSHASSGPTTTRYQPQQPLYAYRTQTAQAQGQSQQWSYRTRSAGVQDASKSKAHSPPVLPTPDDTPQDGFHLQLPDTSTYMHSTFQPQIDVGRDGHNAMTFNMGLGLIFDYPSSPYAESSVAGRSRSVHAESSQAPHPLHQPYKSEARSRPAMTQIQQHLKHPVMYRNQLLAEVARWMNGPAPGLQAKVGLVHTMMAFDQWLPKNPVYDASQYDEEDVDTDEE